MVGKISYKGIREIGKDFSSERQSEGLYRISFYNSLASTPVVIATPDTSNHSSKTYTVSCSLKDVSKSGFTVTVENLSAEHSDAGLNFLVISD